MSQEFESGSLPIKMIEYTDDTTLSPEILAFINNKIQIEYLEEKDETHLFSPLSGDQGVYGVLQVEIPQLITISDEELNFVKRFTNMVGRAIERTTLYQSSNQLVADLQMINNSSRELNVNLEQHDITETVKRHIFDSCNAEQIGVVFFPQEKEDPDPLLDIVEGSTDYFMTKNGRSFVRYVYHEMQKNPKPFFSGNFQSDEVKIPYSSLMVIPMWSSETIFGIIIIAHRTPYYFSFDKYKFTQSFVQHASLAFINSVLKEKLKQIAITDYLTNLYSRNHLDTIIKEEMEKSNHGAFVLFDVDDFKQVNDTYGHYTGDKVLVQVSKILQAEMGPVEIAARWGGEERS